MSDLDWYFSELKQEVESALHKFAPIASPHEGLAVIWEEFEELKKHVWENTGRSIEAREEALQIAAMGLRYAFDLCSEEDNAII